ncbi:MAG: metal-dependent phosphohydrolase [Zoogloeaceae bacterium]|nr:metal-dependent phosphohydrolase [Zoogloeaceae bacterium]
MRKAPRSILPYSVHVPLNAAVAVAFTLLVACIVGALSYSAYRGAHKSLATATDEAIEQTAALLDERIGRIFEPADNQLRLLSHSDMMSARTLDERLALQPLAREVLRGNPMVQAVYAGYPDGDFVLFRPLHHQSLAARFGAPIGADLLVQTITGANAGPAGEYRFYAADGRLLEHRVLPDYRFDPRTRLWFEAASATADTVLTEPYLFFTTRVPGVTLARRAADGQAAVGLDAEFGSLASQIDELRMTRSSELAIVDADGIVIAHHDPTAMLIPEAGDTFRLATIDELKRPLLRAAFSLSGAAAVGHAGRVNGREWRLVRAPLAPVGSLELFALLAIPEDEMFADAREILTGQLLIALLIFAVSVPLGLLVTQRSVVSLRRLAEETRALEAFDFEERPPLRSHIGEIDQLAIATDRMRQTLSDFLETSIALGSEHDVETLLERILGTVLQTARARGGAIYRAAGDGRIVRVRVRGGPDIETALPAETSIGDGGLIADGISRRVTCTEESDGVLRVAVPLITRDGALVGAIAVWLPAQKEAPGPHRDSRVGFIEALSSIAAVAIETRELIDAEKRLLESFIQLIAAAIDAKSPYTGGHCQRVPELAKMLADAAHACDDEAWQDFHLSENDREALHIGAWLHDCGKITTPEYVVDKATKLEGIHDRIHEVRMRFEVLKRDAHIAALEARLAGGDAQAAAAQLERTLETLDAEFAFVAECNLGGEEMDDAAVGRLRQIGARTWQRTLDDRIGISRDEALLRAPYPREPLPAEEPLLADRPWHRIERPDSERFSENNPWGFAMDVPHYKYDRGELHNLTIRRGTLTPEERYVINAHMVQTIMMLSRLPFPRHLANVPEIAGGHHERMDGRGYPRRLKREDMSVLARAMAVADVFEALTAADRPYKAPKTLSESIGIMARMVADQHLDPDLFRLFLESGTYRSYAERFLDASQLDEVDVPAMLEIASGGSPAAA